MYVHYIVSKPGAEKNNQNIDGLVRTAGEEGTESLGIISKKHPRREHHQKNTSDFSVILGFSEFYSFLRLLKYASSSEPHQ